MSDKNKNQIDLIEDITVEELLADGLIENVEVSAEEPSKKKADDANVKTDTNNTPEKAVASVDAAAKAGPKAEVPVPVKTHIEDAPADPVKALQATIDAAIAAAPEAEEPKTKTGLINAMYQHMSKMTTEQLAAMHSKLAEGNVEEEFDFAKKDDDESEDETAEKDDDDSDEEKEDEDEKEVKEDINSLMASHKFLPEEFRSKASKLFESTVNARVADQVATIQETYNTQLAEEVEGIQSSLTEKIDSYLSYVVKEWIENNKVAVEKGIRTEIAEGFIEGLKNLFKENYIEVPEGKENLVESLSKEISKLEGQLATQTEANMKLAESVNTLTRKKILAEASLDLAATEAAKLVSLTESVVFETAESFQKKVNGIKETYFLKTVTPSQNNEVEISLNESAPEVELSPIMEVYSTALSRTLKK